MCLFTRDLGAYASAWSDWLKRHGSTGVKGYIFLCPQGPAWLEEHIAKSLAGTEYGAWMALLAQGRSCPAQVDGGAHRCPAVVGQVGVSPHRGGMHPHPPPPRRRQFSSSRESAHCHHTKVKRKMVSPYDLWRASVLEYFTREHPSAGAPEPIVGSKRARDACWWTCYQDLSGHSEAHSMPETERLWRRWRRRRLEEVGNHGGVTVVGTVGWRILSSSWALVHGQGVYSKSICYCLW